MWTQGGGFSFGEGSKMEMPKLRVLSVVCWMYFQVDVERCSCFESTN